MSIVGSLDGYREGGGPAVAVANWYVLGPIVKCISIVSEEGQERRSGSAHFSK